MKVGYPCINRTLSCKADRTFRLQSYSEERFRWTVENNLNCLQHILEYNQQHGLLFFRITSDLIPFASHPVCTFPWQNTYQSTFEKLGGFIQKNQMRISMHPDQFIVLNSPRKEVVERSIAELMYHAEVLDLLKLDSSAKIQLHLGGVYGDITKSMQRFIDVYSSLDDSVKRRLVIENDDRSYRVSDCLSVSKKIDVPVLFDYFHHNLLHHHEMVADVLVDVSATWSSNDGIPMVDYSSQKPHEKPGRHADHIDSTDFKKFIAETKPFDFDVMLEIKDKEKSASEAIAVLSTDKRFLQINNKGYGNHGSKNPHELLSDLLTSQHFAVIATESKKQPYTNLVSFVCSSDFRHLFFPTKKQTQKFVNITKNNHVAVLFDNRENTPSDLSEAVTITAIGQAKVLTRHRDAIVILLLQKYPTLSAFLKDPSCVIIDVKVKTYQIVQHFEKIQVLKMADRKE